MTSRLGRRFQIRRCLQISDCARVCLQKSVVGKFKDRLYTGTRKFRNIILTDEILVEIGRER